MGTEPGVTRRVWLVGEQNPLSPDPRHALYPHPPGCAGARLARALGLSAEAYLAAFERRNLLPHDAPRWSAAVAREAADALLAEIALASRDVLVLLGARVAAAFDVAFRPNLFEPRFMQVGVRALRGRRVLVLPHPSGRSREWNDPGAAPKTRVSLTRLIEGDEDSGPCPRGDCPFARCTDPTHRAQEEQDI